MDKNTNEKENKRRHISIYLRCIIIICSAAVFLNLLSVFHGFCDWYTDHIFPLWINTYGRFSNLFPFSFGEILIMIGVLLVLMAVISGLLFIFLGKKAAYRRYTNRFYKFFAGVLTFVLVVMTLNCNLLYGCTPLVVNPDAEKEEYTLDELEALRNWLVLQCNNLAIQVERKEDGTIVYNGNLQEEVKAAMQELSDTYPRLSGYYPDAKPILGSVYMSQAYYSGVYFPFSMEANYNSIMYIMNYPAVISHEFAHLKGYIYEDEANYIAYLACIGSNDSFVQYSGFLSVLNYVDNSYYDSVSEERYRRQPEISAQVFQDNIFLELEVWESVEEKSVLDTETFDEVTDTLADTSMKIYGVEDGIASYDRVTDLLLQYYDGILY